MKILKVSQIFVVCVAVAAVFFLVNSYKGAGVEAIAAADDKYKALDSFSQALSVVENAYVEPLENQEIIYGAIKGMLKELDPHSDYYDPAEYKSFQESTKGAFGGLGL